MFGNFGRQGRNADDEQEDKPFYPADINGDEDTDFGDYAMLAGQWQEVVCGECGGTNLNGDGRMTWDDLEEMAYNWLAGF
ncbi:MAG: hypothetical protein FVQ85_09045 [Planctomycetes bacterium]|nr:hypothetical protein [Planctomycetota bacterium]